MFFAQAVCGCETRENLRRGEGNQGPAEAEPDEVFKDQGTDAHAEKFSERGKPGDLPSVFRIERRSDAGH